MLVALRRPQATSFTSREGRVSDQALDVFAELSQAMAASLDFEKTLQTILESVERLIPADLLEITIWDPIKENLIPYRFVGTVDVDRRIEKAAEQYSADSGYSGYLVTQRNPLKISDVDAFRDVRPAVDRKQYPYSSYLGMPLQIAGELVGTLELASLNKDAFSQNDLESLQILSGQAAVTLKNSLLFLEEQKRVLELSGLAKLAQAVGALGDTKDLYERLVDGISTLLQVKTLGFLVYQESQHLLFAQKPFVGIPAPMLELFRVTIQSASPAEEILFSNEAILAQNAPEDERIVALGLDHMAVAAGIQNTILMPLTTAGRQLGYLQVADKKDGLPFNQDDLRILTIITSQVATIIENATLVKESQERAQRSEALRRVASLAASVATLDEILNFSLREIAQLLRADVGLIYLLDENIGELSVHKESLFGVTGEMAEKLMNMEMSDPHFHRTVTASRNPFLTGNLHEANEMMTPIYSALEENLKVMSVIDVPLVIQNQGVGEIILTSRNAGYFDRNDLILVSTTASQLSNAVEKSQLLAQTDDSLQRRVVQLLSLMRVSREMNTTLDLEHLLHLVYDEALRTTKADCGSISLFDLSLETDENRKVLMHIGDPGIEKYSRIEENVVSSGKPVIIKEYGTSRNPSGLEQRPPHAGVLSSLIVPIAFQGRIAGLVHLHSHTPGHFDDTSQEIAQSLAVQAAIALGNTQRYQEQRSRMELLNRHVETMSTLFETSHSLQAGQTLEQSLEAIAFGIQDATPFSVVLISIYDREKGDLLQTASAGVPLEKLEELKNQPLSWRILEENLKPEYRLSRSYLVTGDGDPFWLPEFLAEGGFSPEIDAAVEQKWIKSDTLWIPLSNASGDPLGMIQVDAPRDGNRPDRPTIETLEIFSLQASLIIETYLKINELTHKTTDLQGEVVRSQRALQSVQGNLPILLHKDLEHTLSIQRLNQRTRRIRAGLDIIEIINEQPSRVEVLTVLGQEILARMDMDVVLVAEPSEGGLNLISTAGALPAGVTPQALLGQRNPLRACLQSGGLIFVSNLDENAEWKGSPLLSALEAKAFICLPILFKRQDAAEAGLAEQGSDSVVMAVSNTPIASLTPEDEHIFSLLSRQVSDALADLEMLREMNHRLQEVNLLLEFSRQLGSLDTSHLLQSLLESAMQATPSASAGMVALWSDQKACLLPKCALGYVDSQKILQIPYRAGEALPGQAFELGQAMRVDEVDFALHYNLPSESLLLYRDATQGRLPVSSLIIPLQTFDTKLGVLVLDNFKLPAAFTEADQALVNSLARQTALTLENVRLYQASEERSAQLQALTEVAGTITSSLQVNELIGSILDQVRSIIPFETGTLWLRQANLLTIRAALGFEDSEERIGLSAALEDSLLLKEMITTSHPLVVGDVRTDPRFPSLVEPRYLSWMGIPLLSKGQVVGVIALEKLETYFYTPEHVKAMVTFAGQAAVALENANLYEDSVRRALELDERSQRLALLNRVSTSLSRSLDQATIFSVIASEIPLALTSSLVSVVTLDASGNAVVRNQTPQKSIQMPVRVPNNAVFNRMRETLGIFATEDYRTEPDLEPVYPYLAETDTRSLLVLPMASGSDLVGLVLVHTFEAYRFSPEEIELARTICNQAAVATQNARLFAETERLFAETQKRSTEISILYDLGVGLTQVMDQNRLLDVTFENITRLIQADAVGVALADEEGYLTTHIQENGMRREPVIAIRQGDSPYEQVMQTNEALLISDMQVEKDHPSSAMPESVEFRSWLGVALVVRGAPAGVISVLSKKPDQFDEDDLRLLKQVANNLSVSLDNSQLFSKVQNYAADLEKRVLRAHPAACQRTPAHPDPAFDHHRAFRQP